ncbi:hypothetical protein TURU_092882 [Turdus rufiventris]|nr:hypothetical protein TURU_092882 [Turdus rufiventris]
MWKCGGCTGRGSSDGSGQGLGVLWGDSGQTKCCLDWLYVGKDESGKSYDYLARDFENMETISEIKDIFEIPNLSY